MHTFADKSKGNQQATPVKTMEPSPPVAGRDPGIEENAPTLGFGIPAPEKFSTEEGLVVTLYFGQDLYLLNNENYQMLLKVRRIIAESRGGLYCVSIEGHASREGPEQYNLTLSKKRITTAENILSKSQKTSIEQIVCGESKASDETGGPIEKEKTRSRDRRITIYIMKQKRSPSDEKPLEKPSPVEPSVTDESMKLKGIDPYLIPWESLPWESLPWDNILKDEAGDTLQNRLDKYILNSPVIGKFFKKLKITKPTEAIKFSPPDLFNNKIEPEIDKLKINPDDKELYKLKLKPYFRIEIPF